MSKISEQKALEAYPPIPLNISLVDYNSFKRTFYAKGYDQAMQDLLEKAITYLTPINYTHSHLVDLEDFKNYIQNE